VWLRGWGSASTFGRVGTGADRSSASLGMPYFRRAASMSWSVTVGHFAADPFDVRVGDDRRVLRQGRRARDERGGEAEGLGRRMEIRSPHSSSSCEIT
jgi:hypothetical protein